MPESGEKILKNHSYKDSGVDIDKTNRMLSGLKNVIGSTHNGNVLSDLSSFCGSFSLDTASYKNPVLTSSTDGVGTKLILARETGNYSTVGQDLVAMSINDLVCSGSRPLFFLDYIACGKVNTEIISTVIRSIADACRYCNTALLGGETAEMPDMYGDDEIDLAGFAVGIVEKDRIFNPGNVKKDDIIVGLPSSGLHSNGFSLIRKVINDASLNLKEPLDWTNGKTLAEILLTPTKLYSPMIDHMIDKKTAMIKGIANITGGGFYDNINRIIPGNLDAVIRKNSWNIPDVFNFIKNAGSITEKEMYKVFNMGIGMALIIPSESYEELKKSVRKKYGDIMQIGKVTEGTGTVKIEGIDT